MSGRLKSTGKLTNHGKNSLDISNISNLKILGLDIYSIPLSTSLFSDVMRGIGKVLQPFFHPVISPTFCHIALKLNLENLDDIVIIEYGQYLTEESLRYFDRAISNLGSSDYRSENNKAKYYYIKKDVVRITKIEKKNRIINLTESVSVSEYLNEVDNSILDRNSISKKLNQVNIIKCNVKKNMTLKQLINILSNEKWEANEYNVAKHNCQDFAAEVIKILKAVRINESDKIRLNEKYALPNCMIRSLSNNEEISKINILGRIPIFGLYFDIVFANRFVRNNIKII